MDISRDPMSITKLAHMPKMFSNFVNIEYKFCEPIKSI